LVSTERIVSAKTLTTGEVTSQPGSPGQPRVPPYQRDSAYFRVPPYLGVRVVVVAGLEVVVVVAGLEVVWVVVVDLAHPARSTLEVIRIKAIMTQYFLILSSCFLFPVCFKLCL
jgi:hypothetical protein